MDKENKTENELFNQMQDCAKLRDEYLAGWQREKADFINYKKEESQRVGSLIDFLKSQWILEILKIADNFERAIKHKPDEKNLEQWAKGVEMISNQLNDFLKSQGINEIKAIGEVFNPELHEAIEEVEGAGKNGEIVEVLEKGYTMNNKLIRASKVKVVK